MFFACFSYLFFSLLFRTVQLVQLSRIVYFVTRRTNVLSTVPVPWEDQRIVKSNVSSPKLAKDV